jgi:hypothetical protein
MSLARVGNRAPLRLRLSFSYTLYLSPQHEISAGPPILDLWITQSVSDAVHTVDALAHATPAGVVSGEIRGRVFEFPVAALETLGTARLMVYAYSRTMNHHGEQCYLQAGCARVALAELFAPGAASRATRLAADLVFPMLADDPVEGVKGRVEFVIAECAVDQSGHPPPGVVWRVPDLALSPLEPYIEREESQFGPSQMPSTWGFFDNVNLFRYVELSVLPAAAYIDSPIAATSEEYYQNAARVSLRIMELTEEMVLGWQFSADHPDECRFAAYWLAQTLSVYVQSCDYVSDEVVVRTRNGGFRVVPVEWFQQTRVRRGAMDCEDSATETMVEAKELRRLRTASPLLLVLQRVLSAYYAGLLLDGVSGAEINLQAVGHLDAHMNSAIVNRAQFVAWTRDTLPVAHRPSAEEIAFSRLFPPIVMMEGTGPLDPNGVEHEAPDDYAESRVDEAFSSHPLLTERTRRVFHYSTRRNKQSPFYKACKIFATNDLAETGVFLWMLCKSGGGGGGARPTAGVAFADMASASADVFAMPETPLTEEQRVVMHTAMLDLHPQPRLLAPGEAPDAEVVVRARAQVVELRAAMARIIAHIGASPSSGKVFLAGHEAIRVAKYAHFDDQRAFLRELILAVAARRDLSLVSFAAEECQATPDRGFFRLRYRFAA